MLTTPRTTHLVACLVALARSIAFHETVRPLLLQTAPLPSFVARVKSSTGNWPDRGRRAQGHSCVKRPLHANVWVDRMSDMAAVRAPVPVGMYLSFGGL
jgi:hypothetical protein